MASIANPDRRSGYIINDNSDLIISPDGPVNHKDLGGLRTEIFQNIPEFYELEPAEVIDVYLDETDEDFPQVNDKPDWSKYGNIEARLSVSAKTENDTVFAKPLDTNIKQYPLPGEFVIIAEYMGQLYYTQKMNLNRAITFNNSPNFNFFPGLSKWTKSLEGVKSKINHFKPDSGIRQVLSREGDITFNGRFGQSIRFGSNIVSIVGQEENTGKQVSPNVIIRAGQGILETEPSKPVQEDINLDGASLWMTTDQTIPIDKKYTDIATKETKPEKWDGPQIVLSSNRIVFNSKIDSIHAFSNKEISMASKDRINLESPVVNVGAVSDQNQHALGAELTHKMLIQLLDALIPFADDYASAKAAPGIPWMPTALMENNVPAATLSSKLHGLKSRWERNEGMSETVYLAKIKTE
jgi:hypothetical protein